MTHPASKLNLDQSSLENALRDALKSVLEKEGGSDPRTGFYNKFKEEVTEHDDDFHKKYDEDLNTTLIFSGLFSAVASAFIINIQPELKPDYEELNNTLLELLLNVTAGNAPPGQAISPPRWPGPNPAIRQVQAILYATLCATLFAAFLATLGKQWLNRYRQTDTHGSIVDRCRDRERKLNGIENWRFNIVMQSGPLTIQGSLGLLGSALARYLWETDRMVSSVVIGFTFLGVILYTAMVAISVLSFDCPFQTPISLLIRSIIDAAKLLRRDHPISDLTTLAKGGLTVGTAPLHGLHRRVFYSTLSLSWEKGYKFDARCITRMLVMSTDLDTIRLTMDFVQEVIWDARIQTVPLGWIYRKLISCFDFTHPQIPILIPTLRDVAYLSAKALTHIQVQQLCLPCPGGDGSVDEAWQPDNPHTVLGSPGSRSDPDLESALLMVDKVLGRNVEIPWDEYQLSPAHHLWVSHLFVYYALRNPLSDDASVFIKSTLALSKSPGDAVITDCLYIINIMLGTPFRIEDLTRRDKSRQMDAMVDKIFINISNRFQGPSPLTNADVSELPLRALKLVTQLRTTAVATRSYELFKKIMQSTVSQEKKMVAARVALHAAYHPKLKSLPPVGDPKHILDFLHYHIDPRVEREARAHAISSVMHAIDSASDDPMSQSWNWRIRNAGELLTGFLRSPDPKELRWWYGVLWLHYGGLDPGIRSRLDEIAMNRGDRVDLKRCRIAIEKKIWKIRELDGAAGIMASLEEASSRLTALIEHREKSHLRVSSISGPAESLHVVLVRDYRRQLTISPTIS